jgi:hypothetical protein
MPARLLCLWMLTLLTRTVAGDPVAEMELKAGLAGQIVAGGTGELEIRLFASRPFHGDLVLEDANGTTRLPVHLDERKVRTIHLPVRPGHLKSVGAKLLSEQGVVTSRDLGFEQRGEPLTLIASSIPSYQAFDSHRESHGITPLILAADGLPHLPQTYESVAALVMDPQTLSRLSADQYRSLADYLGRCGVLLLRDMEEASLRKLQGIAGCQGRLIETFDSLSQIPPTLQRLGGISPLKPPALTDLLTLQATENQHRIMLTITLYLLGYLLLTALAVWRLQKTQLLLLLPFLAAGAAALVWNGPSQWTLISWSEMESGDSHMRTSSLLIQEGDKRGENNLELDKWVPLRLPMGDSSGSSIQYMEQGDSRRLTGFTPLLVQQHYQLFTLSQHTPGLLLSMQTGSPEIIVGQRGETTQAKLIWHGQAFDLPPLSAGARWQPDQNRGRAPTAAAELLLSRRLAFEDTALLLPSKAMLNGLLLHATQSIGWLVIRPAPGGPS